MKSLFSLLAPFALGLALTACESVPAPYATPEEPAPQGGGGTTAGTFINESFSTTLGSFTNYTTSGSGAWKIDFKTAKASGYDATTQNTTAGTYYLVSQEVDLTKVQSAHIAMEYILRYNKGDENQQLLITDKFATATPANDWTVLNQKWTEGSDWKTFSSYALDIPSEWLGKKVRIAFKYNTNDQSGSTWEIKNVKLAEGKAPAAPSTPAGPNLLSNGDFESWTSNLPTHWQSASTASNATLSQSNTARSGQNAVLVQGDKEMNKRIAYKELTLKAGNYTMAFYARGEADGASARPGYAIVENGKIDAKTGYKYGNYTNDIKASEWTAISHNFQLEAQTTVCILVMNPKGKGNLLIDDFSLTTSNGGIVENAGGGDTPPTPPASTAVYEKKLTDNAEGWELVQGTLPSELTFVWKQDTKYGLVASASKKVNGVFTNFPTEAWSISPEFKPTETAHTLTFDHAINYLNGSTFAAHCSLHVREGKTGAWQPLSIPTPAAPDANGKFAWVSSGAISLAAYAGKSIQLGFRYTSTAASAPTWEFKNLVVK